MEELLDQGHGVCFLEEPRIAAIAQRALLFFEDDRYDLHAWVIMPNHVHALVTIEPPHALSEVVASWKSFSARIANEILGRKGPFWQRDYFDRFIRDEGHFEIVKDYIETNPIRAGLCKAKERWAFGSAFVPGS